MLEVELRLGRANVPVEAASAIRDLATLGIAATPRLQNADGIAIARRAGLFAVFAFGTERADITDPDRLADHAATLAFERGDYEAMADIDVVYEPVLSDAQEGFPKELQEAIPYLTDLYLSREPAITRNNYLPRLCDIDQASETDENRRGRVMLTFRQTKFYTFLATNRSLDHAVIPAAGIVSRFTNNDTIRQAYVKFPYNLAESPLANPLSVHVVVVTKNLNQTPQNQVLITVSHRGRRSARGNSRQARP